MIPVSTTRKAYQSQEDWRRKAEPERLRQSRESEIASSHQPHGSHQQLFGSQNMQKPWKTDTKAFMFEDL